MRLAAVVRCPRCRGGVESSERELRCRDCGVRYRREGDLLGLAPADPAPAGHSAFYNAQDAARFGRDAEGIDPDSERFVREFLATLPPEATVLELGAGRGAFDGAHPGRIACDISWGALRSFSTGARVQADAMALPFAGGSLDAVFSVFTIEHVPDPQRALAEIDRCLAPGGEALLYPAWLVRPWAAKALDRRAFSELGLLDRARKATIPIRHARPYRFLRILPGRLSREWRLSRQRRALPFEYRRLDPNLDAYLAPDSDAFSSMDPQAMSAYFVSRGYADLRRTTARARLMYMYEPVHVRKP